MPFKILVFSLFVKKKIPERHAEMCDKILHPPRKTRNICVLFSFVLFWNFTFPQALKIDKENQFHCSGFIGKRKTTKLFQFSSSNLFCKYS